MNKTVAGIEIGGTKLQIVIGDSSGDITHRERFKVDATRGGEAIRECIATALPSILVRTEPAAIGVGFGGPVDWRTGQICCSHQVKGWHDFHLGKWLREITGLPVFVENDSNCATLGEAMKGAGRGLSPVFYFNMGSGVGGGLAMDGKIYHGARPGEVEFGHLRLDREGTTVEDRCSGWAVDKKIRDLRKSNPGSLLCSLTSEMNGGEAKVLRQAFDDNDHEAHRILDETACDLAFALSHAVHLFHPEMIVMGGGLSLIGEPLRNAVARMLPDRLMEAFHPAPEIRLAELGEDSVPVGALILAGMARPA